MRKPSTRKIVTASTATATAKPVAAKPVKPVATAPVAVAKPADTAKPADPVAAVATPAVAKPTANIARTAATVARQATNFAVLSDRDTAYLAFYGKLVKRAGGGRITLADIVGSGERPHYDGSNKPHDAGVIVRLTKAGLLETAADGIGFTVSATGRTHRAFTGATA